MRRTSRLRQWLILLATLVIVFSAVAFFVVPPIAKSQIEKRLSAELGRPVTVEKVRFNPYALSVTLENFAIQEKDGTTLFLGWRRLYVNVEAWASILREWTVREIALDGFQTRVAVNPDHSLNFSDLLQKFAPKKTDAPAAVATKPGRPIKIGSLRVAEARLDFSDRSHATPFASTVGPVSFVLTEFRTVSERGAPYRFEAVTESGEKFAWAGNLRADPPASSGEFALENIALAKYAPYYAERVQADLTEGTLSVRGRYDLSLAPNQRVMALRDGAVALRGIKVIERATKESAAELPEIDVKGIQADAVGFKVAVDLVAINGGHARVRREKDGTINLLAMLQPAGATTSTPPSPPAPGGTAAPRPDVKIGEFALKGFQLEVADLTTSQRAQLGLKDIDFSLRNISLAQGASMPLQLGFGWAPQGAVRLDGNVSILPVKADLTIDVAGLELLPVSPYLEQFVNARLTQGAVTAGLVVEAAMPAERPLALSVMGGAKLEHFGLVDSAHNEELAGFQTLALRGLQASTSPELAVKLDEIEVSAPFARVAMNPDKTLNLAKLVRASATPSPTSGDAKSPAVAAKIDPSTAPAPSPAATPAPSPRIEVAKVVIRDGDYRFTDRSVQPNVSMAINQFGGTIEGLSSTNPAKANLDLKAMVDGAGPIAIAGKIDPLGEKKTFDLKVDFKNVDLVPLSPYSGKFAGYELARGKLLLDVKLKVDGSAIDASNVITLNQFTFGSPVKSPDATSLPVRLGVALLKDLDGKIVIDVPVQGRTDDPSFRVGRVVLRVIVNLLTKAAVSPFALLGGMFGGGGDELAFQEFTPGATEVQPNEVRKLETMVKALTNRPGLSVELQGSFDRAADAPALKRVKFAENVRRLVWEKKRAGDPNLPPPNQLQISPEEEAAAIKLMYDDRFPPGTPHGSPIPPPPEMVKVPPAPEGGFARFVDSLTGKSKREERAAQEENARRLAEHAKAVQAAVAAGRPPEEMRARLIEDTEIDDNDLRALAQSRARAVRDYFVNTGKISPDRLFLGKDAADPAKEAKGPRVFLALQ